MVGRPVRKIIKAAEQITQGDFSARVPDLHSLDAGDGFGEIGDCFNKMAQELSGTETLRTDFIANVSHELKTPLAVIQNYGTMLQQPGLSEEKRLEYAKAVTDASRRLANLITNILKLNKLENQQIFPQAETYDLGEQLCQCLLAFENAWEEKGLDIQTQRAALFGVEQLVLQRGEVHRAWGHPLPDLGGSGGLGGGPGGGHRLRHSPRSGPPHL